MIFVLGAWMPLAEALVAKVRREEEGMSCKNSTTHYMGCECHEAARNKRIAEIEQALAVAREALEKISVPASCTTDGSESREEYEELYDFWHYVSVQRLSIATDALARLDALGRGEKT